MFRRYFFSVRSAVCKKLMRDKILWSVIGVTLGMLAVALYTPLNGFFKLAPLSSGLLLYAVGAGVVCVLWCELIKATKIIGGRLTRS